MPKKYLIGTRGSLLALTQAEQTKIELEKLGARVSISEDSLRLYPSEVISEKIEINTYDDHRMAMAFAPLALKVPITINDCEVVTKSFPSYWEDLKRVGFDIEFQ